MKIYQKQDFQHFGGQTSDFKRFGHKFRRFLSFQRIFKGAQMVEFSLFSDGLGMKKHLRNSKNILEQILSIYEVIKVGKTQHENLPKTRFLAFFGGPTNPTDGNLGNKCCLNVDQSWKMFSPDKVDVFCTWNHVIISKTRSSNPC